MSDAKPVKLLIAAMGGEGGGVLMNWIVNAAWRKGYPVQATSVPGVAQRTGATTYYIEMLPAPAAVGAADPIFALNPTPGEVDVLVATELAEATRVAGAGYITPDRTHLIVSTQRSYLMLEKMAMGEGRLDDDKLSEILTECAKEIVLFDALAAADQAGSVVNAVMLGAIAATGVLNISLEEFIAAIEREGKAVQSNISGLKRGFEIFQSQDDGASRPDKSISQRQAAKSDLHRRAKDTFSDALHPILDHAIDRLVDYQDVSYGEKFLARLEEFKHCDHHLLEKVAKNLAVRMSYEDIIRVAQVKVRAERFKRIAGETNASPDDLVTITEFFKPGIPEISDLLPPGLAKYVLDWGERTGRTKNWGIAMEVRTTTISGFLKVWLLSKLRAWRKHSYRWSVEQKNIDQWLDYIKSAMDEDADVAFEIAELARLIKGYGGTHRRGTENFNAIVANLVTPYLDDKKFNASLAASIRSALEAALADPDGRQLEKILKQGGRQLGTAAE